MSRFICVLNLSFFSGFLVEFRKYLPGPEREGKRREREIMYTIQRILVESKILPVKLDLATFGTLFNCLAKRISSKHQDMLKICKAVCQGLVYGKDTGFPYKCPQQGNLR